MSRGMVVMRAEYVLAEKDRLPLKMLTSEDEDPILQSLAQVQQQVRGDLGESLEVGLFLLPLTEREQERAREQSLGKAQKAEAGNPLFGLTSRQTRAEPASAVDRGWERTALKAKFGENSPLFRFQLMVRARVPYEVADRESKRLAKAKARGLMQAVNASFKDWRGANHLRVVGLPILGTAFAGSDAFWRSMWFDYRLDTGYFRPPRRNLVSAREMAPLMRPPTKANAGAVARSGGLVPAAPHYLPRWYPGRKDVIPLGETTDGRMIGLPRKESLFVYVPGSSGMGKTELGMLQFIHLTRVAGDGGMFIDPGADAIARLKEFMTEDEVARRVVEINFSGLGHRPQPGWNPLAMEGLGMEHIGLKVQAIKDSIAAAMHWHVGTNTRALNLTGQAAKALIELNMQLPADTQATVFQMTKLLDDQDWREEICAYLSPDLRSFFGSRFSKVESSDKGAITPLTNLLDDMRLSPATVALLGQSRNTYDTRKAMDEGKIVLVCPGSGSTVATLLANLLVYDVLRAAFTREDTPPADRKLFWLFLDELQTYDRGDEGNIAAILEQTRKFGIRAWAFNQDPARLKEDTRNALMSNRSHLITARLRVGAAKMLTPEWRNMPAPETVSEIPKWNFVAQVEVGNGRGRTRPFKVRGVPIEELWADYHHPERVAALDSIVDGRLHRRPYKDVSEHQAALDEGIVHALRARAAKRVGVPFTVSMPRPAAGHPEADPKHKPLPDPRSRRRKRPQDQMELLEDS